MKREMSILVLSCRRGAFFNDFSVAKAGSMDTPLAPFWCSGAGAVLVFTFSLFLEN